MTVFDKLKELEEWRKQNQKPKSARAFASEIITMKGKDTRREALEKVPENIRHIVKFYVCDHFAKRNHGQLPDLRQSRITSEVEE